LSRNEVQIKNLLNVIYQYQSTNDQFEREEIFKKFIFYNTHVKAIEKVKIVDEGLLILYRTVKRLVGKYLPPNRLLTGGELLDLFVESFTLEVLGRVNVENFTFEQSFKWMIDRCSGAMVKRIKDDYNIYNEELDIKNHKPSEQNSDDDNVTLSRQDQKAFRQWENFEEEGHYEAFVRFVGGIHNILTKEQYELYIMRYDQNIKQNEIAQKLGTSGQNISKTLQAIRNKIQRNYIKYIILKSTANTNTYNEIKRFVEYYDEYGESGGDNSAWFHILLSFLKSNYKSGDLDIEGRYNQWRNYEEWEKFQLNKIQYKFSILDVLIDSLDLGKWKMYDKSYEVLVKYLKEGEIVVSGNRQKENIVKQAMSIFNKYINEVEKSCYDLAEHMQNLENVVDF
jgi:RNA polymerase sigma factor (sigma-70 family)